MGTSLSALNSTWIIIVYCGKAPVLLRPLIWWLLSVREETSYQYKWSGTLFVKHAGDFLFKPLMKCQLRVIISGSANSLSAGARQLWPEQAQTNFWSQRCQQQNPRCRPQAEADTSPVNTLQATCTADAGDKYSIGNALIIKTQPRNHLIVYVCPPHLNMPLTSVRITRRHSLLLYYSSKRGI